MRSLWSDAEAERLVNRYATEGVTRDLALRVYSSRLLGGEPRLVLHGGGNTSVKTTTNDLLGEEVEVLCVKGSGWDMAAIEPAGLPAVRLNPVRKLRRRAVLSDEEMVRVLRANLLDPGAPNPSVETLLHAFLPHKYIDHTHSTAVLSSADQSDGARRCADLYGRSMGLVPYIMPGFLLAKKAVEVYEADPAVEGLVLLKHGIFTFGDTAQEAYDRMISAVSLAEEQIIRRPKSVLTPARLPAAIAAASEVAPILRGACGIADPAGSGAFKRFVLEFRSSPAVLNYVNGVDLERYGRAGVATPDHTIRTKNWPLIVPAPEPDRLYAFKAAVRAAVEHFVAEYHAYFARHNAHQAAPKRELDPMPRVILVPGLGLFGLGRSAKDARIAADIAESTVETVTDAEAIGRFEPVGETDLFEIEYWSLEQAKLGQSSEKPLAGQIAAITGGAGTIGFA
ncbi:MAG: bifunctional aldolase/short-chain dehydrogenase, partial [Stellaceae bacterium]